MPYNLTPRQQLLLRAALSYVYSNVDDLNDCFAPECTDDDTVASYADNLAGNVQIDGQVVPSFKEKELRDLRELLAPDAPEPEEPATGQELRVTLEDVYGGDEVIDVRVTANETGVTVYADGHGDHCTAAGHGAPVHIEFKEGELYVCVWDDINQEDMTHSISLAGARESNREEEDELVADPGAAGPPAR